VCRVIERLSRRRLLGLGLGGLAALAAGCTAAPPAGTPRDSAGTGTAVAGATGPPAAPAPPTVAAATPPASTGTPAAARVVWSNWAVDQGSRARLEEQRSGYEAAHPGAAVELQNTPSAEYVPKLLTAFAADQAPDVIRLNTEQLPVFASRRQLVDLDPLFARTEDPWIKRSDLKPGLVDRYRLAQGLVGLPYGGDMDALFYNRSIFAEAGQTPPPAGYGEPTWSYDRALELAKALTKRRPDGGAERLGIDVGGYRYEGHVENAGGSWFSADGATFTGHLPPAVAAVDWLAALRLKHGVAATPATDEARSFNFASGKLAMSWSGVSQVSNRLQDVGDRFDWDVAPVPRWGSNRLVVKSGFSALVLNAKGRQVDAAWSFLHWITGPVGSLADVELGWSVPVFSSLDGRYFARVSRKKNLTVALEGPRHPSSYPMWTNPHYAEAWRRIQTALDLVLQGRGTAGDLLAAAKPEVDAILAKTG
jgi:multiple sugar transport system substrate-binding protein